MRAAPTATVSSPPATAANRMATPSGRLHCQPRNWNSVDSVFCAMKISRTISTRKPSVSADHSAAARVRWTADCPDVVFRSPGWRARRTVGGGGGGGSADAKGSLDMAPSLPFRASNETGPVIALGSRKLPRPGKDVRRD